MNTPSKVSKSSLVNSLAKRYDPKALQNQGPVIAKKPSQPQPVCNYSKTPVNLNNTMDTNFEILNQKMENVLMTQNDVVEKLDNIMQDIGGIERDIEFMKSDITKTEHVSESSKDKVKMPDIKELFVEMITNLSSINKYAEHQAQKLHGVEQILLSAQNVIHFIVEEMKIKEMFTFVQKKETPLKPDIVGNKIRKEETEIQKQRGEMKGVKKNVGSRDSTRKWKSCLNGKKIKVNKDQINEKKNWRLKGTKSLKKKKPPDSDQTAQKNQSYTYDEKVQKLNQENLEKATVILVNSSPPESCPEEKSCISISIQSRVPTPQGTPIIISEGKEHISASPYEYSNAELLDNICVECTGHYSPDAQDFEGKTKPGILFDETDENIDGENEYEDDEYDEEIEDEIVEKEDKSDFYAAEEEEEAISLRDYAETTDNTATTHDISQCPEAEEVERAESVSSESDSTNVTLALPEEDVSQTEPSSNSKRRVPGETVIKDDTTKSRVDTEDTEVKTKKTKGVEEITLNLTIPDKEPEEDHGINDKKDQTTYEEENAQFSFDVSPPPPAPFTHRIVSAKHAQINHFYTVDTSEMLGGGRYGQVHRCAEISSGLSLAAKIIKVKSHKEKEEVKNEIQVMNQLNHVNLIQLYDAFESRNDIVLIMEYVEGGELFDRIIDENYNLSEADTIQFIKQILEGIQYMHQMYIVHLDLKPENIMCVSRTAYQVKIIDFGLARRYKPREKLKVHFGTPEFLAPEVVNYDYVSFPTDMWSVGVITFMMLSGLSPFLGEDDNETLNNILACQYDFEGEEFENISEPAKDFITKLLIKEKCWRMSATEALKHPWISDSKLHYRISQQCLGNICPVSDVSGNK